MAYVDYLPTSALIGDIDVETLTLTLDGLTVSRTYAVEVGVMYYETGRGTGIYTQVIDATSEYVAGGGSGASGAYTFGDEVKVTVLGLKYRYADTANDFLVTGTLGSGTFDEMHPSRIDVDNNRVNFAQWVCMGVIDEFIVRDIASSSKYTCPTAGRIKLVVDPKDHLLYGGYFDSYLFGAFGVKSGDYDYSFPATGIPGEVAITLNNDGRYKTRNVIDLPSSRYGTGNLQSRYFELLISPRGTGLNSPYIPVEVTSFVSFGGVHIGSQLYGHTSNRVSEFKKVIADGSEKSMIIKSYDIFGGHVIVDEADLQKAEFVLAKATQGDYVFHTGTGAELYDQRAYLGNIKYKSPIENAKKYKINISGQSLSYGVENPLIAPDSTDGYPI